MESVPCLKHLSVEYELGCGFFLFGSFQGISRLLGMLLLFGFGLKILCSDWFLTVLIRCLCDLIANLKIRLCSRSVVGAKNGALIDKMNVWKEKSNSYIDSDEIVNSDSDTEYDYNFAEDLDTRLDDQFDDTEDDENKQYTLEDFGEELGAYVDKNSEHDTTDEDSESDVPTLRRLLKIERQTSNTAHAELAKERAAAATAAEEAMAMILRLQHEKSAIEMESIQYRRLAEEKQVHDQEVIQSLQWLVWRHECDNNLWEDEVRLCRDNMKHLWKRDGKNECDEEVGEDDKRTCNGDLWDALENVFYSSLDADNLVTP